MTNLYEKIGAEGLEQMADDFKVNDDIDFVKSKSKKDEHILDLACGYGRVSLSLASDGYTNVAGLDLAPNLIRAAKKKAKAAGLAVHFDVGDMTRIPYEANSFDKVFCLWNSFNEILAQTEQVKVLKEVFRVLKYKGQAFIVVYDGESKEMRQMFKSGELNPKKPIQKKQFMGAEVCQYIYTKGALRYLVLKTKFTKNSIRFVTMHKRRRILLTLYK